MVTLTSGLLADRVGGDVAGARDCEIAGAANVRDAQPGDAVFAESEKYFSEAARSGASVIIGPTGSPPVEGKVVICVPEPKRAFVTLLQMLEPPRLHEPGVHSTAIVHAEATLGADVAIGPWCTVGRSTLADGVAVEAGCHIGDDCKIGARTVIKPNAVLYDRVEIGADCLLHAGCVLGADGFGFIVVDGSVVKIPHLGGVCVGNGVEIGANACIDRARTGWTVIEDGARIDDMVMIAHNARVGASAILCGMSGIAGSADIGAGAIIGAQAGVGDNRSVGARAMLAGQAGCFGNVPDGEVYSGYPAGPHKEELRRQAHIARLPRYAEEIKELRAAIRRLEAAAGDGGCLAGEEPTG